jgi:hypothetical protein
MGLTYVVVNAGSSSVGTTAHAFERDRGFPPDGARPESHGDRGGGWMFGMIRNIGIIAVIVALVVIPKSIRQKRTQQISASMG